MHIAFIGGGNMAAALLGGLLQAGRAADELSVVELDAQRCDWLRQQFGVAAAPAPGSSLAGADAVVLAVKPQQMREACTSLRPHLKAPLVVSIAAGTRAADIARWLGVQTIVRSMPNTPALIGRGITGMVATAAVSAGQRTLAESILRAAGEVLWLDDESLLDAVTAISGSGPAYVFYFLEALARAGVQMGLGEQQARGLAVQTFAGAAELAARSSEPLEILRQQVTSKGGTTAAALAVFDAKGVGQAIVEGAHAAQRRGTELGDEFGRQ